MKKKIDSKNSDDLRSEYNFRELQILARGGGRKKKGGILIEIEPDVAKIFPDSNSVNEALRFLSRVVQGQPRSSGTFPR